LQIDFGILKHSKIGRKEMKFFTKAIVIFLAVFFTAGLYGSAAFAVTSLEKPPGEPPHGVAIQDDAAGTKLYGVLVIEFYNYDTQFDIAGGARVVLRLRQGNILQTFFKHVPGPLEGIISNPGFIQETIQNQIAPDILNEFFPGEDLTITVKNMEEFDDVDANSIIIRDVPGNVGNSVEIKKKTYYLEEHENCANGVDDDNDGLVDIYDPDCAKISFFVVTDIELAVK
jgi:hypothetical protein